MLPKLVKPGICNNFWYFKGIGLVTFRNLESLESVHFLDSQEVCLHFIWVHSEDLILYFCEVSKSLEFITF